MATKEEIATIKSNTDIVQIINEYVSLKKAGKNWIGLCPFHNEKTASFFVNSDLGLFKCFGCDKKGDVIKFLQEIKHQTFFETIEQLAFKCGIKLSNSFKQNDKQFQEKLNAFEIYKRLNLFYRKNLLNTINPSSKNALNYIINIRKINLNTLKDFQIGFAINDRNFILNSDLPKLLSFGNSKTSNTDIQKISNADTPQASINEFQNLCVNLGILIEKDNKFLDKFFNRIVFPIFNLDGKVIAFSCRVFEKNDNRPKYINSPETIIFKKGDNLFGLFQAKEHIIKNDSVYILEGQTDVIACYQNGLKNSVASLGTGLTENQLIILRRFTKNIIFIPDNDIAGFKALIRGVLLCTQLDLNPSILFIPFKYKDVDEFLKANKSTKLGIDLNKTAPKSASNIINTNDISPDFAKIISTNQMEFIDFIIKMYLHRNLNELKHIKEVLKNKENILKIIIEFIYKTNDPIKQEVYKEKISEKLNISKEDLNKMSEKSMQKLVNQKEMINQKSKGIEDQYENYDSNVNANSGQQFNSNLNSNNHTNSNTNIAKFNIEEYLISITLENPKILLNYKKVYMYFSDTDYQFLVKSIIEEMQKLEGVQDNQEKLNNLDQNFISDLLNKLFLENENLENKISNLIGLKQVNIQENEIKDLVFNLKQKYYKTKLDFLKQEIIKYEKQEKLNKIDKIEKQIQRLVKRIK